MVSGSFGLADADGKRFIERDGEYRISLFVFHFDPAPKAEPAGQNLFCHYAPSCGNGLAARYTKISQFLAFFVGNERAALMKMEKVASYGGYSASAATLCHQSNLS